MTKPGSNNARVFVMQLYLHILTTEDLQKKKTSGVNHLREARGPRIRRGP